MKTVVIFGGSGFIGRHIISRIAKNGYKIIVPYQRFVNEANLRFFGNTGQIIPLKFHHIREKPIIKSLKNADIIINLKTKWDEKNLTFDEGIYNFNVQLADLIKEINKKALFIFFSGLGTSKITTSLRIKAIAKTEEHIIKNYVNYCIIRPGIILGGGDQFLEKLIPIFKYSLVVPLFGKGNHKFQPVYFNDITAAVETIILKDVKGKNLFELAGTEIFSYKNFYKKIAKYLGLKRYFISIPFSLVSFMLFITEKMSISILTKEQLSLFREDNLYKNLEKGFKDLQIKPKIVSNIIKLYIKNR